MTKSVLASNKRETCDLKMPIKSDGTRDMRYVHQQFCNNDGTRDMRTNRNK